MEKIYRKLITYSLALLMIIPVFSLAINVASAQGLDPWGGHQQDVTNIGLGSNDPRTIAANVIKVILGFLGIVAVIIILLGGFKWMTAAGNEDKVEEAKKLITAGIIGLVIILAAYGIATFVINSLMTATGS